MLGRGQGLSCSTITMKTDNVVVDGTNTIPVLKRRILEKRVSVTIGSVGTGTLDEV